MLDHEKQNNLKLNVKFPKIGVMYSGQLRVEITSDKRQTGNYIDKRIGGKNREKS